MLRYPQVSQIHHQQPISRTLQYKKITKPLLERKRRARINRCLEQLKDLMVGALEAEGENINKLEKADILELTVRHLHRITKPHDPTEEVQRFQAGFTQCASEACGFLLSLPGLDARVGKRLVEHLGRRISQSLESNSPALPYGSPNEESYKNANVGHCEIKSPSVNDRDSSHFIDASISISGSSQIASMQSKALPISHIGKSNLESQIPVLPRDVSKNYPYQYFDKQYPSRSMSQPSPGAQQETAPQFVNNVSSTQTKPSLPSSSQTTKTTPSLSPRLICPQPTRPLVLQMPSHISGPSMPVSPATSTSSVGDINNRLDTLEVSPQSPNGEPCMLGSPNSEDNMWRPW